MKERVGVAIIGSGITGLTTAYSLIKKGVRDILILEKGHLASGASTRNGGGIRAQFATRENILLAKWSIERFKRLGAELGVNFWFRQGGYLFVAESEEELGLLKRTVEFQRGFGLDTRIVDCPEVLTIVPSMVCDTVIGGSFRKGDGVLFPFPLLYGYVEHLRENGVEIATHCEVTSLRRSKGAIEVQTSNGTVLADKVLNAAGGWSSAVGRMMGIDIPTKPVRHQILASEPLEPFLDPMVVTLRDGFYMSQSPRGELIGGLTESGSHGDDQMKSGTAFCEQFSTRLVSLFPRLSDARILRQWGGFYDMSPDANPILDVAEGFENAFVACGYSGHGFMISPAVGEFMACLLVGQRPPFPTEPYKLDRFSKGKTSTERLVIG